MKRVNNAIMFDNGCEWLRCDFHLHTRKDKEFQYLGEDNSFVNDYVSALNKKDINIGIITNHNKFDLAEYKALKKAAGKKDIYILPGVELSVKDGKNGIHTLIIFNPDDWLLNGENHIDNFLTAAFQGISNRENENTCCNLDLNNLLVELEKIDKDYFIVFAHIEQRSGLIEEIGGGRLGALASTPEFKKRVLGLQKLRTIKNKEKIKSWFGYEVALVEGSDPKCIEDIGKGKVCYVKIGEYSFNSLKFALQNYESRVSDKIPKINHGYIKSISFVGGKLDSIKIPFAKELNTLIGIRGSGKSSILESIRYALNLDANIDKEYKNQLIKNTLGSGGEVSLEVIDGYGNSYKIKRLLDEQISILDNNESEIDISLNSIINNPLYFGQKDLSFTQSGYALDLLEKLVGNKLKTQLESIDAHVLNLESSIRSLLQVFTIPEKIKEMTVRKNDLEYKLKVFKDQGISEKLKKQTSNNKDEIKLNYLKTQVNNLYTELKDLVEEIDKTQFDISNYISEYNSDIFKDVESTLKKVLVSIDNILVEIENISISKLELENYKERLEKRFQSLKDEFASIKREINDDSLDPDSFVKYSSDFTKLEEDIKALQKKNKTRTALIASIKQSIVERDKVLESIFNSYEEEVKKINGSQNELEIKIYFKGNKEKFKDDIKLKLKGTGLTEIKVNKISDEFSDFVSLIADCIIDEGKILKTIVTDNEFAKVYEKINENYTELIKLNCPDLVEIYYHDKLLEQHSIGQRASALILFVLTQEENDLVIIDQPEDDLDNQIIYEEVISTLQKKKRDIQFIFATHNANIPVLGDAECVIATQYDEKIHSDIGNIDCQKTHDKIVDIMEGGRAAFEKRKLIYTNWNKSNR